MDFQNVNPLNVRLNLISGNMLPMTSDNTPFPVTWKIYSAVLWCVLLVQNVATIPAFILVPKEKSLQNGGTVNIVVSFEVFFLLAHMYTHKDLVHQLIQKLNNILRSADETMKNIVQSTIKPLQTPLEIFCVAGIASVILWCAMPLVLLFKRNYFFYDDFGLLLALSKQPFSSDIFVLGNCIVTVASTYVFTKKVALDVYMINLMLLITAQYRYTAVKLAIIFRKDTSQNQHSKSKKKYSNLDTLVAREIKVLCRHHCAVIQMMLILKKLLSANMSLIYLINIFRFCFVDLIVINAIVSKNVVEVIMLFGYLCGSLTQLYVLCFCVQQLFDASTKITNKAFNEEWYVFAPQLKCTLMLMIMSNNLKCELSTFGKYNLSLPSFMTILNQSYSVALLLLKVK